MVNLFEILENAPIGQHLYSPQYGELSFCGIDRGFNNVWKCSIFSHHNAGNYITTDSTYTECVPYNDETAYLIGTDIDYDGKYRTY